MLMLERLYSTTNASDAAQTMMSTTTASIELSMFSTWVTLSWVKFRLATLSIASRSDETALRVPSVSAGSTLKIAL